MLVLAAFARPAGLAGLASLHFSFFFFFFGWLHCLVIIFRDIDVPDVVMVINFLTPSDNRKPNDYRIFFSVDAVHQTPLGDASHLMQKHTQNSSPNQNQMERQNQKRGLDWILDQSQKTALGVVSVSENSLHHLRSLGLQFFRRRLTTSLYR